MKTTLAIATLSLFSAACMSAASNPDRGELRRVDVAALDSAEPAQEQPPESVASVAERVEPLPGAWAEEVPIVGTVGDRPIELPTFLARLWMRENQAVRDVLENIVIARLAMLEAERLGIGLEPEEVEAILDQAFEEMRARLEEAGSTLTVEEYIRRELEMDPGFYAAHLRDDAIVQLLLQRTVRAWALGNGRTLVELLDLDQAGAEAFSGGTGFDALAEESGGGERIELIRSERNDLARLAFATEVGAVGGPLVRGGTFLLLRVLERHEGAPGLWDDLGETVLASLAEAPVAEREFVQWRAAMIPRYRVNLAPFADLVGDPGP